MGQALGQAYVARTFSPEAKARALSMVRNMEAVLREDLSTLAWMSPATRTQAIAKLNAFTNKIGYPDKWRDYSGLTIEPRPVLPTTCSPPNAFESRAAIWPRSASRWTAASGGMTPPTVNAYYNPTS